LANRHNRGVNSTETPGGSGIPAGWYDDPSGQGLRWWDGEQWTEHVHTPESAAAAAGTGEAEEGEREAPPPELVRLRESIRAKGTKGVGLVLGGLVLVVVVIALLLSGGSDESGKAAQPGEATPTAGKATVSQQEIKQLKKQLKNANLPKAAKKSLERELKKLEKQAGAGKSAKSGQGKASKKKSKQTTPDEEGS
jgi:hypothetical protein